MPILYISVTINTLFNLKVILTLTQIETLRVNKATSYGVATMIKEIAFLFAQYSITPSGLK